MKKRILCVCNAGDQRINNITRETFMKSLNASKKESKKAEKIGRRKKNAQHTKPN